MPQMFQQALWIGGTDQEDEGQELDLRKSMTVAGLERSSAPAVSATAVDESEIFGESYHFLSRCSHAGFSFAAPGVLNRQCSNVLHPDEMEPELDIA
jgi:hypothetical protein